MITLDTPIEKVKDIYFKRQDLYEPYPDIRLCGAKVAQCQSLINHNLQHIRENCNSTVITASSSVSPQGLIVARAAKEFGLKSVIVLGGSNEQSALTHKYINMAVNKYGAKIDVECKMGYNSPMYKRVDVLIKQNAMFNVGFGMSIDSGSKVLVDIVAKDVSNFPKNIDTLIIPVGSGLTAGAILHGFTRYATHKPKRIVCVQIVNHDRTKVIDKIKDNDLVYEFVKDNKYPYQKLVHLSYGNIILDPRYESKAFEWLLRNKKTLGDNILYWIIGNTAFIR